MLARIAPRIGCCVLCSLVASDALADMGPLVLVPVVSAALLQLVFGLVLIAPQRERGARKSTFGTFIGLLAIPWIGTLVTPTDSLYHFVPLFISIVAAFVVLYWRSARQR
jgi:hypothetical protein